MSQRKCIVLGALQQVTKGKLLHLKMLCFKAELVEPELAVLAQASHSQPAHNGGTSLKRGWRTLLPTQPSEITDILVRALSNTG